MQTPPFHSRPRLHLALTQLTGSPGYLGQAVQASSALSTPPALPNYSPFRSAGLKPPALYGSSMRPPSRSLQNSYLPSRYAWLRLRRIVCSKTLWLMLMVGGLMLWWLNGGKDELDLVKLGASELGKELFQDERTRNLQFFPASNPKIHYVGRWTATPNQLRRDGTFPGVYFDITVTNTTTLLVSLHNIPERDSKSPHTLDASASSTQPKPTVIHVPFRPVSMEEKPSPPVSLLAQIDQEEYILLPNASALVSVSNNGLTSNEEHSIRIIAPMIDNNGQGVLELEGLWLSKGGKLTRVKRVFLKQEYENEDAFSAENEQIGEKHRSGLARFVMSKIEMENGRQQQQDSEIDIPASANKRKKLLEIITDSPGSFTGNHRGLRTGGASGLLAGVIGWEYLLGEMFGADHVGIGADGMCLIQDCIGGVGSPNGIGDVFFRSGPFGLEHFDHPWMFDSYSPDVIIINIGESDHISFEQHASVYNVTSWDLFQRFENAYISLIKAIRAFAYPQRLSTMHNSGADYGVYISNESPAFIPIFVMRPLRGELEHVTQNVVTKLRTDGDRAVFWLDTSGWLEIEDEDGLPSNSAGDFFLDEGFLPSRWRLTEQGNQRVAIFLHTHVCRYLADEGEKCAFLPQEVYQGKVFDPVEARLEQFLEEEKEKKLKKIFGEEGGGV